MEAKVPLDTTTQSVIQLHSLPQTTFSQTMAARADSPSRRGGVKGQVIPSTIKSDDLEELDEEDEGDEIVQEVEPPVDDSDALNDPAGATSGQYHLWSMDWGDLEQDRRTYRKRPALEDLPDDVREELASMSGADTETRPKQKPKLEPPEIIKETSRGRKSPAKEEGVSDISVILSKPAKTAEERLAVLEARDKLIRIRSNQQRCPKLKNMGKCPDMCPEKERYQRIARHQVDYYEYYRETKEVNLASMVKIYARSSADQQMPLPHDLRPVSVLWMTMSYIVSQFMDLADSPGENLGEWYHFLWDRMRSIRKDITQLALCDTMSVQILEMCARFHIFCMERLREEKMAVFDEKINRENLTKCLQSLQYMYNDLYLKNVSCPNEPEFQAYSILLHINSDLCTSTILGLRSEMRQHEKVQFAINAFLAVTMKNYVRFFKLVKSTTYLNACILHQYFAQVRAHAMHSIIRAYSRQKMRNTYPLSELQAQLLFDSIDDVLEFCRFSKVPAEENNIVLEKTSHPIPMQEKMRRSFVGVECKRQSSIKEIVAGGCRLADTATYHKVHDSFDEHGILKQEAWYAEDQESSLTVEIQDADTSAMTSVGSASSSSIHSRSEASTLSSLQGTLSPDPSSYFAATQSGVLQTQNSGPSGSQKSIFGVSKISSASPLSDIPLVMQSVVHKTVVSTNLPSVSVSDSSIKSQDHQNSSMFVKPVSNISSLPAGQSSVGAKSFVFRLSDSKSEMKDGRLGQSVGPGFASRTLQSIFGGVGATAVSRSPGSSILRTTSSGHTVSASQQTVQSTSSGYWASPSQDMVTNVVRTQNSENITQMNVSADVTVKSPQQKNSDYSFKNPALASSSTVTSAVPFSGFFVPRSENFWGSSSTKSLPVSQESSTNVTSISDHMTVNVSSSVSNRFPASVYGLPLQSSVKLNDVRSNDGPAVTVTGTQISFPRVSIQFSSSMVCSSQSDVAHTSPLPVPPRAVTVPTSIFGLHSRPLTTPQMFPTSSSPSSATVSPQTVSNTPDSSCTNSVAITGVPCETKLGPDGRFLFFVNEAAPNTTPQVTASAIGVTTAVGVSNMKPSNEKSQLLLGSGQDHDISLEMEIDYDDNQSGSTEQLASKSERSKTISPTVGTVSVLLPSPTRATNFKKELSSHTSKISQQNLDENKMHRIKQVVSEKFRQWRLLTYRSKLRRRLQSQDKCAPLGTTLSLEEQVCEYPMPQGCVPIDYQTRLEYVLDLQEVKVPQSVFPYIPKIRLENILSTVLPKALLEKGKLEANMFWKLCISVPSEVEGKKFSLQICEWIDATFSDDSEDDVLRLTRTPLGEEYNLFTSVQKTIGVVKETLKGVNGLLFFAPQRMTNSKYAFQRYQNLIQSSSAQFPLPIVAVVSNAQWVEVCQTWFTSDVQKKRLAAFKIVGPFNENKECISKELTDSISWLTQYVRPAPPFEHWPLREVLLTLMADLWTHVRFSLACRCSSAFQQHPEDLLGLYHDALKHLHKMIVNEVTDQYGDIAPELEDLAKRILCDKSSGRMLLKNPENIKKINDGFLQVQLNVCVPPIELLTVESFCEAVCSYNPRLCGPISHFLCSWNKNNTIDWIYVVESLTELHVRDTIGRLKLKKLVTVFMKSEIQKFRMEPWYAHWLQDRLLDQKCVEERLSNKDTPSDSVDHDMSVTSNEPSVSYIDPDEKLLSDFESMLNELEELKKADVKQCSDLFTSSSNSSNKKKCIGLDIFESQLEYYAKLLKD